MATSTMMTTKILKNLVLGAALGAVSLVATKANPVNAASFNFSVNWSGSVYGTGLLEGFDNDSNGFLTKNELTSFGFVSPGFGHNLNLSSLFSFGSFNLNTGVWNADGAGWGLPTGSYFSWNNGNSSVNPSWATINGNYVPTPVPEPASTLGLLALSTLGVGSMLKRKQQKKATVKA